MKQILFLILLIPLLCFSGPHAIILNLAGRNISVIPHGFYIKDVVLSQRDDTCLGYKHHISHKEYDPVIPGKYIPYYFETNIRKELLKYLANSTQEKYGLQPLILRVNRFFLHEIDYNGRPAIRFDLSVSFIRPTESGFYDDFTSVLSIVEHHLSNTNHLLTCIDTAFSYCFKEYAYQLDHKKVSPVKISQDQLTLNPFYQPDYFKYATAKRPRKALYRSWFDFRDNFPDTTENFTVYHVCNKKFPEIFKYYIKAPLDTLVKSYWGFSLGDSVYQNAGGFFTLLKQEENRLTTHLAPLYNYEKPWKLEINPFTGGLELFDKKDYTMISSPIVFLLSAVSKTDESLTISLNGKILCELTPGKYFIINVSPHYNHVKIKFTPSHGSALEEEIPLKLFTTQMYLLRIKKDDSVFFGHPQTRKDLLNERTSENTVCDVEWFEK
jgi:hypothetical protein